MRPTFRSATDSDAQALGNLCLAIFDPRYGEGWTSAQIAGTLVSPGGWADVALVADEPVGFCLCRTVADETELLLVGVAPNRRLSGIGRQLVHRAGMRASDLGSLRMHLEMRANNQPAQKLYQYFGFSEVGRRPGYYAGRNGSRFDAVTMQSPLPFKNQLNFDLR